MTENSTATGGTDDSAAASDTDGFFGFLAGLYAAALAAPAVAIAVALRVSVDPGVLYFVLLGSVVVVTSGVGWVAHRESIAVHLGSSRWIWAAMIIPFGYFGLLVAVASLPGRAPSAVGGIAVAGALAGFIVGIGLVAASHNRYAKAVLADAEEIIDFRAAAPERDRRLAKWAVAVLFVAGGLGFVGSILLDYEPLWWLFQLAIPMGAALYGTTSERRVTVSDAGLVVGLPAHRRSRPWSAYESYDVTDEAIVVRRAGWSLWGLRDLRRDASEVEDPEEVAAALGEVLPHREGRRS